MSTKSSSGPAAATDKNIQALLVRYRCPTPFHVVRTLFMGHIASPRLEVSPMAPLAQAWGGELPEFASSDEAEELVGMLVHGLWNRLSDHQSARNPFRLSRFEVTPTRQGLHDLTLVRSQELTGFIDGLFGPEEEMSMPRKAHDAVAALGEAHAMFDGVAELLADKTKPAPVNELKSLLRNLQQMTIVADEQINKAVQSCKRARGQQGGVETMATELSSKFTAPQAVTDLDDEPELLESSLSQSVTRYGVSVRIDIYGDSPGRVDS